MYPYDNNMNGNYPMGQSPYMSQNDGQFQPNYDQMQQYQQQQMLNRQAAMNNTMNSPYTPKPQKPVEIVSGSHMFNIDALNAASNNKPIPKVDTTIVKSTKKSGGKKKKKEESETVVGTVEDEPKTLQTYGYTSQLLGETLQQVDMVASEIKEELDVVRSSRTMKGKYTYLTNLTDNLATLLNTKANVIKEINNTITKSNELDYRREKDLRDSQAQQQGDDKYLMDLYHAFVANSNGNTLEQMGPTPTQAILPDSGIVRSTNINQSNNGAPVDAGYTNYLNNLTPEQNTMFYENDPNIKTVVVYDAATGEKHFQVMNIATGEVVPNVTVLDNRFMEDTTLDLKNRIAKNNNLRESFPIVVVNENIANNY